MKANELRIGNWVRHPNSEWDEQLDIENFNVENIEYYTPIPLTEEWLIKFGFVINKDISLDKNEIYYSKSITILYKYSKFNLYINIDEDSYYSFSYTEIQHIHQLQNLYFALTGEELKSTN